jgi:hypothetical protein
MKIRYYNVNNPGTRWTTREFDENGTITNRYRLGYDVNGDKIVYKQLYTKLCEMGFNDLLPTVEIPRYHYDIVEIMELQENGSYVIKNEYTKVWDVTEDDYMNSLAVFEAVLRVHLLPVKELYFPNIPTGPEWIWESVDMTKPYRYRYTPREQTDRYKGNVWEECDMDFYNAYNVLATSTNPSYGISQKVMTIV